MKTYSEKLKDPRWQKKRLKILNRDKWECKFCHDKETTLNIHHLKYTKEPWGTPNKNLITLCEECHFIVSKTGIEYNEIIEIKKIKRNNEDETTSSLFIINMINVISLFQRNDNEYVFHLSFNKNGDILNAINKFNNE